MALGFDDIKIRAAGTVTDGPPPVAPVQAETAPTEVDEDEDEFDDEDDEEGDEDDAEDATAVQPSKGDPHARGRIE